MTADTTRAGDRSGPGDDAAERVLAWVVRHATRLGEAAPVPLRRIRVSTAEVAVDVEWSPAQARPGAPPGPAAAAEEAAVAQEEGMWIRSPMVGTFYRSREPGAPPFVEVGDLVEPGQQVGIVEAMKLMNAVQAEHRGRVSEITARDGSPVQYEEPLLSLVPAD
ncbi:acetyl-CoA carboxylase biotin carboxyl carrier protein [Sphaerisporangium aureirubrum]|uniref:Biotin carboxyl carrier protein of acetyl-CoA carboxylase n=1 Tax=Sphaerisporangium aureirubrum TaxID=1544736 RepID=A0ABW1NW36_9ACTN